MDVRNEVFSGAELLVTIERVLRLKTTEAFLAPEVAAFMLGNVTHESGKIFDPCEVTVPVEQVNLGLAHMPTAVKRVARLPVIVVEPNHVDRKVQLLLDPREVDRTYGVFDCIEPVLGEVCIRIK